VEPTVYRLAPAVVARFVGLAFVVLAVLLFAATVIVAAAGLPLDLVVVVVLVGVVAAFAAGWWLRSRAYVLRCTEDSYQVGLVRGAGVREGRWKQVEQVVTAVRHDVACVELRLRDGGRTVIPVGVLATDREQFVRELQERLQRGHGLRKLS
jgi:hypothetical protein